MEVSCEAHRIIKFTKTDAIFYFRWSCCWGVGEVAVDQKNYQGCQFDVYFTQCQTSTYIFGIVNEFVQYVQELFLICIHTPFIYRLMLKVMIRNWKIKETFILGMSYSKWIRVLQSLDCFQLECKRLFIIYTFSSSAELYTGVPLSHFLNSIFFLNCNSNSN